MHANLTVQLHCGVILNVSHKLERLSDLKSLGRAMEAKAKAALKVFPELATEKVDKIRLACE